MFADAWISFSDEILSLRWRSFQNDVKGRFIFVIARSKATKQSQSRKYRKFPHSAKEAQKKGRTITTIPFDLLF